AQSAAERVGYRTEAVKSALAGVERRAAQAAEALVALSEEAAAEQPDPEAAGRIATLEESLAALDRDREAELGRQLIELESQRERAREAVAALLPGVDGAREQREAAEELVEQTRQTVRAAEREVEAARRDAARIGGELAAVNQFLRGQAPLPGG